jgi:hypothetical protein
MTIAINETARPPYVKFEVRALEDRAATMAAGKYSTRDVDFVVVRQAGQTNTAEFEAGPWLERIGNNPGYRPEWVDMLRNQYAMWKKGYEPTPNGTHVRSWPSISPSQAEMLCNVQLLTVEDLASANESALQRIGIGARELQLKAKAWLDSATKVGKVTEELAALREQNAALLEQNNLLRTQNHSLQVQAGVQIPMAAQPKLVEVDPFG